jgi:hypothetical protein
LELNAKCLLELEEYAEKAGIKEFREELSDVEELLKPDPVVTRSSHGSMGSDVKTLKNEVAPKRRLRKHIDDDIEVVGEVGQTVSQVSVGDL